MQWYICKTPPAMTHIFDELYAAEGIKPVEYFRIKILELLYHAGQLRKEDQIAAAYYSKEHIDIVKRVRKRMVSDLSNKISLDLLLRNEPVSTVTFQAVFKNIYGRSPYAYLNSAKHVSADENGVRIAELDEMSYRHFLWEHRPLTDFWRVGRGYAKKLEE